MFLCVCSHSPSAILRHLLRRRSEVIEEFPGETHCGFQERGGLAILALKANSNRDTG